MEPVDRFLFDQLKEEPRVVCLPTAAGTEGKNRVRYWMDLGTEYYQSLGAKVISLPIIDAPGANNPEFAEEIEQSNFVYLSGGHPDHLHKVLSGSLAWQAIQKVYGRGGVLAGCSAGAMVLGKGFLGFSRWHWGFGLLEDGIIVPHFDELPPLVVSGIKRFVKNGDTLFGIEGSTALIVDGNRRFVRGRGGVNVIRQNNSHRYLDNEEIVSLPAS
jgi:cyanophycinase